tara:strand:+ start:18 stop:251 length:234 start_codon:yes stop_codon:yes gene_type:complete
MNRARILKEINKIFIELIEDKDVIISESTTAEDIDEWDSLTHIQVVIEIEKKFNKKFTSTEILSWKSVGDMINGIEN